MIISGKPELGLQKHQQDAYKAVSKAYENDNRAAVVIPTGCGKSFISLQLMEDNRDKNLLFLAPTEAIKDQMYRYIAKYVVGEEPTSKRPARMIADEHFPSLKIILYPTLLRMQSEIMDKLKPDIVIMDELHRTGADKWGSKIDELLEKNPNAKVLGLTATPDRMDDKNVVDSLFDGKIDYELTLVDAIKRRIVNPPSYVKCDYALREELETVRTAIEQCDDEQTKKELQEKFDKMRRIVEQADGIPELFAKHMTKRDGKYIVFCKNKEHMDELMGMVHEWFGEIDEEPELYSVYSGEGYTEKKNKDTIKGFEESKTDHLKLLFSVDMLNEGLHVEDISGVIMLRPTESRIIYLQQLGRALSSDTTRQKTIVFDLVNNYLKNNLDREVNSREPTKIEGRQTRERGEQGEDFEGTELEDIDIFRIQGETKEFLELLEEVQAIQRTSVYLTNARQIKAWMEARGTTKPPAESSTDIDETFLGSALARIRNILIKPYHKLETEEEREQFRIEHPEIDEVMEIVQWIDENNLSPHLVNAREIKEWMEERGITKPPSVSSTDIDEKKLGQKLSRIRLNLIKPYLSLETEEERERYREEHPEIDEVMEIVKGIDDNNLSLYLVNARQIKAWIEERGTTKPPAASSTDIDEKKLGEKLSRIRQQLIKPYLKLETEEERAQYRKEHPEIDEVMEIVKGIDDNNLSLYLVNARQIKAWMEERGTTKPPAVTSKDEEEKRLGLALSNIRQGLIKPYLSLETEEKKKKFREKHPEIEAVMEILDEIDRNNIPVRLIQTRKIKKWMEEMGTTKPPSTNSKDKEEKKLGEFLVGIRSRLIKPYLDLETEEQRERYREKYPELDEVMEIVKWIDKNNLSLHLVKAREIKEWMEERGTTKPPSRCSTDIDEKKLGRKLSNIKQYLIKPYLSLEKEEQREQYREEHPEIDEVMEIVKWIDAQKGTKKQQKLADIVEEDVEVTRALEGARKLEASYEEILEQKRGQNTKEGDTHDEQ